MMYIPKPFENNNIDQLHQFIDQFSFATLINHDGNGLQVSHIPVMLDREQGQQGALAWHVAKLNPHAKEFNGTKNALCIFHGPHAYISPTWYKKAPEVPTWNYAVVHAYGVPEVVNKDQLSDDLSKMVRHYENTNYSIPDDYKTRLMDHIIGFRMEITRIEGKFKLGQNRSLKDQDGLLEGLRRQNTPEALTLADFIQSVRNS